MQRVLNLEDWCSFKMAATYKGSGPTQIKLTSDYKPC